MKHYTKEINGRVEVEPRNAIVVIKDGRQIFNPSEEDVLADGWVEYVETESVSAQTDSKEEFLLNESIEYLKNTDYKVIKCIEAFLCEESFPYDI